MPQIFSKIFLTLVVFLFTYTLLLLPLFIQQYPESDSKKKFTSLINNTPLRNKNDNNKHNRNRNNDKVLQILSSFKEMHFLQKSEVIEILSKSISFHRTVDNILQIASPQSNFTIVGDTHGQFLDMLDLFTLGGLPSETNPYLFNGDMVDRGKYSLEIVLSLLSIKLEFPSAVYLVRGNHESESMNSQYGFNKEVLFKYDKQVLDIFHEFFRSLPVAAVLNGNVFICHGGLGPSLVELSFSEMNKIDRNVEPNKGVVAELL